MDDLQPGDKILHYAGQTVTAVSVVTAPAIPSRRPESLPTDMWDQDGRLVRVNYFDASRPIHRTEIPESWRFAEPSTGPFQRNAGVKLGYLFPLSMEFYERFADAFGERFDVDLFGLSAEHQAPAEALAGAEDLVRRLIGAELLTASGRPNRILGVHAGNAIVSTQRSPEGQPVPIAEVQAALDRLLRDGRLTIHPDIVGHRSAFIGAVLGTLPGAHFEGSPPTLILGSDTNEDVSTPEATNAPQAGAVPSPVTFEGDLEIAAAGMARGEQASIRKRLFGSAETANCALCGELLPVRFLWTAHIKRRAVCTDGERRDLTNIAMAACVFGCDALYEAGYISVDSDGYLIVASDGLTVAVAERLASLDGRGCLAFTEGTAPYFEWHRRNVFRA